MNVGDMGSHCKEKKTHTHTQISFIYKHKMTTTCKATPHTAPTPPLPKPPHNPPPTTPACGNMEVIK